MGSRRDNQENGVKKKEQRIFDRRQGLPFAARGDKRDGLKHEEDGAKNEKRPYRSPPGRRRRSACDCLPDQQQKRSDNEITVTREEAAARDAAIDRPERGKPQHQVENIPEAGGIGVRFSQAAQVEEREHKQKREKIAKQPFAESLSAALCSPRPRRLVKHQDQSKTDTRRVDKLGEQPKLISSRQRDPAEQHNRNDQSDQPEKPERRSRGHRSRHRRRLRQRCILRAWRGNGLGGLDDGVSERDGKPYDTNANHDGGERNGARIGAPVKEGLAPHPLLSARNEPDEEGRDRRQQKKRERELVPARRLPDRGRAARRCMLALRHTHEPSNQKSKHADDCNNRHRSK